MGRENQWGGIVVVDMYSWKTFGNLTYNQVEQFCFKFSRMFIFTSLSRYENDNP